MASLLDKRLVFVTGKGGAGKTTFAASLGLVAARRGLRAIVCEVGRGDIINSLIVDRERTALVGVALPEEMPVTETLELSDRLGEEIARGLDRVVVNGLWPQRLSSEETDRVMAARPGSTAPRRRLRCRARSWRTVARGRSASSSYASRRAGRRRGVHAACELRELGGHDVVVLDTPPTRNALDFLDAPGRLLSFLDSRALALLTGPSWLGLKLAGRGTGAPLSLLVRVTGRHRPVTPPRARG